MSTETEIAEVKEEGNASPECTPKDNEYKIFDYFKKNTGLLVTCVTALVAVMSFILHFAVGRMNYAYLDYWDIGSIHANANNQNELYTITWAMLYMFVLLLIHSLLSGTSDAFRYYNKLLSTMNQTIKAAKKVTKRTKLELRDLSRLYEQLTKKQRKSTAAQKAEKEIITAKQNIEEYGNTIQTLKVYRRRIRSWVGIHIAISVAVSYIVGFVFLVLGNSTISAESGIRLSWKILGIIVLDLLIYFLPAYFATRCTNKQFSNGDILKKAKELVTDDIPGFPFENLLRYGAKYVLSDKKLKLAAVQVIVVTVVLLFAISMAATTTAKQQSSFPIYSEDSASYAIVYFSGSTVFMEEADVQDHTIVIDTTKQRIVTTDDLSYDVKVFENVEIIRNEEPVTAEKRKLTMEDVEKAVGSFFNWIKNKIGEAMVENEGSIPGTE